MICIYDQCCEFLPLRKIHVYCTKCKCRRRASAKRIRYPKYHKAWRDKRRNEYRAEAFDYLGNCCNTCGYNENHDGLEIDHINPRRSDNTGFKFSSSTWWTKTWDKIIIELDKCQLLCGTCHRIKTKQEARSTNGWKNK